MIINVKRQNSIKTADYFEILNDLPCPSSVFNNNNLKNVTTDGVIINPGFSSELYNKKNIETIYLKAAAIRFLHEKNVYIVLNETHSKCALLAKEIFLDFNFKYERGFLTNTHRFVSCEDAIQIIKNYKKNNNHIGYNIFYKIEIYDKIKFFKDNILLLETTYKKVSKLNKIIYILDLSSVFYKDEFKEKNDPTFSKYKTWNMFVLNDKIILSEKNKEFSFSNKKRIILDIV